MPYPRNHSSSGSSTAAHRLGLHWAASRADMLPKLVAMQRQLRARHFAIFRISGGGLPGKRKLVCEVENWEDDGPGSINALVTGYGELMLDHIETSMMPLVWAGADHMNHGDAADGPPIVKQLPAGMTRFSGLAFPARLGAMGNGFVIFTANMFNLDSDLVIEHHVLCCQIMSNLLALDERKTVPAEMLSERETACLQLAGDGRISEEIAENLGLSVHTVNAYLGSATTKLDAVNRIQAIAKALRLGYIQ